MDVESLLTSVPEQKGLIIIIAEKQEGKISHDGKELERRDTGRIIVVNRTGGPIYDFEIDLRGYEKTNLPKTVSIAVVKADGPTEVSYDIADVPKAVDIAEIFELPSDLPRITAYKDVEIPFRLTFYAKNNTQAPAIVDFERDLPQAFVVRELPPGFIKTDTTLKLERVEVAPQSESKKSLDVILAAKDVSAFNTNPVRVTWFLEGATISGVDVVEVRGTMAAVEYYVDTTERMEERGTWDCYVVVTNKSQAKIKVQAEVAIAEGEPVLPEEGAPTEGVGLPFEYLEPAPGVREHPTLVFKPVEVEPGQTVRIGPFVVKNPTAPKTICEIKTWIIPIVIRRVGGVWEIEGVPVYVVHGEVTKDVSVEHPAYIHGLTDKQVVAHLKEDMRAKIEFKNAGSAELDYIRIEDVIPADFAPPKPEQVKVMYVGETSVELPAEKAYRIRLEPEVPDPSVEHKLVIEISGLMPLLGHYVKPGDSIVIEYPFSSADPKPDKTYEFPVTIHIAPAPEFRKHEIRPAEVPKIQTVPAVRKVTRRKEVQPVEDQFEVHYIIKNEGTLPERNLTITDYLPADKVELLEETIEPKPESVDVVAGRIQISWLIEELAPGQEIVLKYRVKLKPGARVADLLRVTA